MARAAARAAGGGARGRATPAHELIACRRHANDDGSETVAWLVPLVPLEAWRGACGSSMHVDTHARTRILSCAWHGHGTWAQVRRVRIAHAPPHARTRTDVHAHPLMCNVHARTRTNVHAHPLMCNVHARTRTHVHAHPLMCNVHAHPLMCTARGPQVLAVLAGLRCYLRKCQHARPSVQKLPMMRVFDLGPGDPTEMQVRCRGDAGEMRVFDLGPGEAGTGTGTRGGGADDDGLMMTRHSPSVISM